LLDLSLEDLGLHGASGNHFFKFSELPGLKPLDLKRETNWQIGHAKSDSTRVSQFGEETLDHWLEPVTGYAWRAPYAVDWLCVPDALERQLLTRRLAATSRYKVLFADTLAAVSNQLQDEKPFILVLDRDVSDEDLRTLGLRPRDAGLLLIAPSPMPLRQQTSSMEWMSWERFSLNGAERRQFDLTNVGPLGDIKRWTWTPQPNWRAAVLQWVEKRLHDQQADTLFEAPSMLAWLEAFDPLGRWFESTSDLLHLCEIGHLHSHKKLPKPHDLEAGKKLTRLLFSEKLSKRGGQLRQLTEARWRRTELAWRGALPMDAWLSLIPASHVPPSNEEVLAIASAKTPRERKKAADHVISLLDAGNPMALRASGLLKENKAGDFDFEHRTLVGLMVRDQLTHQITHEPAASWSLACFDTDRRPLVDAALDAVSLDTLAQAAERLVQAMDDPVAEPAASLGASEALFVAFGRRIANREAIDDRFSDVLRKLAGRVVGQLDLTNMAFALPVPWSRPIGSPAQKLDWIGACWAWSLYVKAPESLPATWLFPGWGEALPEAPEWLSSLWPEEDVEQLSTEWQYFFKVINEWVMNLDQPPAHAPRILNIALLGRAAHGVWAADPAWWQGLIQAVGTWSEKILLAQFKAADKGAAARLWPSHVAFERGFDSERRFAVWMTRIRFWLLAQLSPAEGLENLAWDDLRYLDSCPATLPPAFRAPLLRARCQRISFDSLADTSPFIARFGPSALPVLPELLMHDWLGSAAAQWLWAGDSDEAERLLRGCETLAPDALANLTDAIPARKVALAAQLVLEKPTLFLPWWGLSFWARRHLPTAGMNAPALVKIIRLTSAENPETPA
jgi:hypothetical protein